MELRNWLSQYHRYFKYVMAIGALIMTATAIYLIFHLQGVDQRIHDLNGKAENLLEETALLNETLGNVTSYLAFRQGMLQKAIEANKIKKESEQVRNRDHIDSLRNELEHAKRSLASTEAQIQRSVKVVNDAHGQISTLQSDRSRAIAYGKIFLIVGLMVCLLGLAASVFPKPKSDEGIKGAANHL